ncbi:MAG: hypothetical protein IT419_14360 [Planctomycetes bacterium]|nr:hypothetical protein [Planctomycetota bacterium]
MLLYGDSHEHPRQSTQRRRPRPDDAPALEPPRHMPAKRLSHRIAFADERTPLRRTQLKGFLEAGL